MTVKDTLFDTDEKIKKNLEILRNGSKTPFWALIKKILQANIDVVTERLLTGVEGETKEDIDRLRDRLRIYKEVMETPEKIINSFEKGDSPMIEFDPYET